MAFGFGSTCGASTFGLTSSAETLPATFVTIHIWICRLGNGGGDAYRIWDRGSNWFTLQRVVGGGSVAFGDVASTPCNWTFTEPAIGIWTPITVVVDTSSSTNDPVIWVSGRKLTVGDGLTQNGADKAYTTSLSAWGVGDRSTLAGDRTFNGYMADFAVWDGQVSDSEIEHLHRGNRIDGSIKSATLLHHLPLKNTATPATPKPWSNPRLRFFPDPPQLADIRPLKRYWLDIASGAISLIISRLSQSQTIDNLDLVQANVLAVNDSTQSQTIDNLDLVQSNVLAVADSAQAQTIDNLALVQANVLAVNDSAQSQTIDNIDLIQSNVLAIADTNQSQTIDNVVLDTGYVLIIADSAQSQTIDNLTLTQQHVLSIADSAQAQAIDNLALSQDYNLTIADLVQSQTIDNIVLDQSSILAIQDLAQSMLLDGNVTLLTQVSLVIADLVQSQLLDNIQWTPIVTPAGRVYAISKRDSVYPVPYHNRIIIVVN